MGRIVHSGQTKRARIGRSVATVAVASMLALAAAGLPAATAATLTDDDSGMSGGSWMQVKFNNLVDAAAPGDLRSSDAANFDGVFAISGFDLTGAHGLDIDSVLGKFVLWNGNSHVWALDPTTWTITELPLPSGLFPSIDDPVFTGILGSWKYLPGLDVFAGAEPDNGFDPKVWIFKPLDLQVAGDPSPADAAAPGALLIYLLASGFVFARHRRTAS